MTPTAPRFRELYLFVNNIADTVAFYTALGLEVETVSETFARIIWQERAVVTFGTAELTRSYDPSYAEPRKPGGFTLGFEFDTHNQVDHAHQAMVDAGYTSHLAPCTPPWQSRFAILLDPDAHYVALHGPRDLHEDRQREQGG